MYSLRFGNLPDGSLRLHSNDALLVRERELRYVGFDIARDLLELVELPSAADKSVSGTCSSGSAGTSDTMYVVFVVLRKIIIENSVDSAYVYASCGNICRNENICSFILEAVHHLSTLCLFHIAVEPCGAEAVFLELLGELIDHCSCVAEYHCGRGGVRSKQEAESVGLSSHCNFKVVLLDQGDSALRSLYLDMHGIVLEFFGYCEYLRRHSCREEDGLSVSRSGCEDRFDVLSEAHIEHFVSFVEDSAAESVELERASAHMVHNSAGSADDDVRTAFQLEYLLLHTCTAVDRAGFYRTLVFGKFAYLLISLKCELTSRAEYEDCHCSFICIGYALNCRESESGSLAGAGV